jgi:hypothetical protein
MTKINLSKKDQKKALKTALKQVEKDFCDFIDDDKYLVKCTKDTTYPSFEIKPCDNGVFVEEVIVKLKATLIDKND